MKGVILSIHPRARIVDITHHIGAYQIAEAGFVIAQAYPFFPKNTVHLIVVDPGVGTSRRPILAQAAGQFFVAPDNGVLSMTYSREKHKVRAVTNERYFLKPVSQTFHGRDVFSPVAAHLARGTPPARFGKLIQDYLRLEFEKPVRSGKRLWTGSVLKIDNFGNLITNFRLADFPQLAERPFEMAIGLEKVERLTHNYAESPPGELFVIEGSSGYLEVSLSQASAARRLGCGVGAPVELTIY
jgi:S-adenosylmethionine hydrolase